MARNYSSTSSVKTLASNIATTNAVSLTLNEATDDLPTAPFMLVINPDTDKEEVVLVVADQTGYTPPTYKISKGQDGTTPRTHTANDEVRHMIVGSDLQLVHNHLDLTTNVHGYTATNTEINILDGATLTTTELNYVDGVTSPIQTQLNTKAPLASPTLTGVPLSTTAAADTNTTQIATTAYVISQASSSTPIVNGTAATGTSLRYSRQDHVHPTDTTRAPLASPTFTGTVTLPTSGNGLVPVGSILMWAHTSSSNIPTGWLLCNGQSTASYTALAAVVGANVPDLRGRFPVGYTGSDPYTTWKGTGGNSGLQAHTHTAVTGGNHAHGGTYISGTTYRLYGTTYGGAGTHTHDVNGSSSGTQSHDHGAGSYTETAAQGIGSDGAPSISASILSGAANTTGSGHDHSTYTDYNGDPGHTHTINATAYTNGALIESAHGNLPPYFAINFIIKH